MLTIKLRFYANIFFALHVTTAIGLASSAVGLTSQAATTAQTIRKLLTSENAPDKSETSQLLNNLATELTAANITNVQLSEALKELSQQLHREDEFERQKARYQLFQTPGGDFVFKLREEMKEGQPTHYLCPVCLNRDKLISYVTKGYSSHVCQTDRSHFFEFDQ